MARGPQSGATLGVALLDDVARALGGGEVAHELEVGLDRGLGARRLDEQARARPA